MSTPAPTATTFRELPIDAIRENPWNPRRHYDPVRLDELTASIREKGIIEPIVVRRTDGSEAIVEIVAGSRRFRAADKAGLVVLPCIVKDLTDAQALEFALTENVQRADMNVVDEARGYEKLQQIDKRVYTVAVIAARTGQHESRVYKLLKLLTLEKDFLTALAEDRLTMGHAERLVRLTAKQRKDALDNELVWRESPLFRGPGKFVPTKADLAPLHELDEFIQSRTAFDPNAEELKHFQPALAEAREQCFDQAREDVDGDVDEADYPTLLRLSDDSLVRMQLGAAENAKDVPLSPSKWKQVKPGSCEHAQLGAVVHGGTPRVLTVCIKRSCAKHWPVAKKKATKGAAKSPAERQEDWKAQQERERRERDAEQKSWEKFFGDVFAPALVAHAKKLCFSKSFVTALLPGRDITNVAKAYDVKLENATLCQVLFLADIGEIRDNWDRSNCVSRLRPWGFKADALMTRFKTEHAAAQREAAKQAKATKKADAKRKPAKKGRAA